MLRGQKFSVCNASRTLLGRKRVLTELSATGRTLSASAALRRLIELRIFLRCRRCSTPRLLLRSSSFRSYRNAPSTAAAMNASWY